MIPIGAMLNAMKVGEELQDPAKWKDRQTVTNLVGALVASVVVILRWWKPGLIIPEELSNFIVELIGAILVLINYYLTKATSKKVGIGE